MHITFAYSPSKEAETIRAGFSSIYNKTPTPFAKEAQAAGIDMTSDNDVVDFVCGKIAREHIDVSGIISDFTHAWKPIEAEAEARFRRIFMTDWDPGEVTAYLTFSSRCPYRVELRYYFVSMVRYPRTPIRTSLHELTHFYTHQLIEPLFPPDQSRDKFNEFKEALSVLLNLEFADLIEIEDRGYPQHQELRRELQKEWQSGADVYTLVQRYLDTL